MESLKYNILAFFLFFVCLQDKSLAQDKIYKEILACLNLTYQVDSLIDISKIQWDYICKELSSSINDGINPNEILKKIEAISGYDDVKKYVIGALYIAKRKMKMSYIHIKSWQAKVRS